MLGDETRGPRGGREGASLGARETAGGHRRSPVPGQRSSRRLTGCPLDMRASTSSRYPTPTRFPCFAPLSTLQRKSNSLLVVIGKSGERACNCPAIWLQGGSPRRQIPTISLKNSLFAGNAAGDGCDQHYVASVPASSIRSVRSFWSGAPPCGKARIPCGSSCRASWQHVPMHYRLACCS